MSTYSEIKSFSARMILSVVLIVTCSLFAPTESAIGATIKNGVNCKMANAQVKVGKKVYRCAKNPYVKPQRRTWTLSTCLTAYQLWKDANDEYANWKDLAKLAGPEGEKMIDDLQMSIKSLEETMKTRACKAGQ